MPSCVQFVKKKKEKKKEEEEEEDKKDTYRVAGTLSKFENHVHGLLVIRRGVEIQGYKEAMCLHGALKL